MTNDSYGANARHGRLRGLAKQWNINKRELSDGASGGPSEYGGVTACVFFSRRVWGRPVTLTDSVFAYKKYGSSYFWDITDEPALVVFLLAIAAALRPHCCIVVCCIVVCMFYCLK